MSHLKTYVQYVDQFRVDSVFFPVFPTKTFGRKIKMLYVQYFFCNSFPSKDCTVIVQ